MVKWKGPWFKSHREVINNSEQFFKSLPVFNNRLRFLVLILISPKPLKLFTKCFRVLWMTFMCDFEIDLIMFIKLLFTNLIYASVWLFEIWHNFWTYDTLLKPPLPVTGLFLYLPDCHLYCLVYIFCPWIDIVHKVHVALDILGNKDFHLDNVT